MSDEARSEFEKVINLNSNHENARKELGYIKYKDQWLNKEECEEVLNKEKGLFKYGDKWLKQEEMEALRAKERLSVKWDFTHKIQTKVFTILTNIEDEEERRGMFQAGDNVYDGFIQLFTPYLKKEKLQTKLPPITMHYFQASDQMIKCCQRRNIPVPSKYGFAMGNESFQAQDTNKTIDDSIGGVILHEGIHILDDKLITAMHSEHYWIIEGFACYFESLQKKDGKFILGERTDTWELRGPTKYYELEKFCNFNREQWDKEIQQSGVFNIVYCQASALFRYFMQAENGKYKDKFIKEVVIGHKSSSKDLARIFGFNSINDIEDKFIEFANTIYTKKISK